MLIQQENYLLMMQIILYKDLINKASVNYFMKKVYSIIKYKKILF